MESVFEKTIEETKKEIKEETLKSGLNNPKSYKNFKKNKKVKKEEDKIKYKGKKFVFGLGKEFSRIHWASFKTVFINLLVVAIIILFLATLFFGIDYLVLNVIK
ncbi:MAG: preprotein translocase subunit SecE [Mycoplasmataceae bacterium]|nr:preprotein translocase subunit SecE [Mycoplasmataceae bacterium]